MFIHPEEHIFGNMNSSLSSTPGVAASTPNNVDLLTELTRASRPLVSRRARGDEISVNDPPDTVKHVYSVTSSIEEVQTFTGRRSYGFMTSICVG